ncbi:ClpP/crotonase [Aspergillus egyptiacus]|nr:ClpP/crotonase [Aspergillus egyptiacus]
MTSPTPLFTIPIPSTGGTIVCTNPTPSLNSKPNPKSNYDHTKVYILTFTSPPDNRLTPAFISAFLLALDILEHRHEPGVVITTSGIPKFYSNGLDLELVQQTEGFFELYLWKLFRRLITYPMPTISLLNGHAFAGGFMLSMYHDYRIMNPSKGFVCLNELDLGVPLQSPMMGVFSAKLSAPVLRELVLEARRVPGAQAVKSGIVDALGGMEEALAFVEERGLVGKGRSGIYGALKEEMYRGLLEVLDDHEGNLKWREGIEERKEVEAAETRKGVEKWEEGEKAKAKL